MEKIDQALEIVNLMSKIEQKQLLDQIALRLKNSSKKISGENRDNEMWLHEVTDALHAVLRSGGSSSPSLAIVKRSQADTWSVIEAFMNKSGLSTLKVTERQSAYRILAQLLIEHASYVARRASAPLSPKLVFNCVNNISGLFDGAYPGYLEAGLAQVVVLRKL